MSSTDHPVDEPSAGVDASTSSGTLKELLKCVDKTPTDDSPVEDDTTIKNSNKVGL